MFLVPTELFRLTRPASPAEGPGPRPAQLRPLEARLRPPAGQQLRPAEDGHGPAGRGQAHHHLQVLSRGMFNSHNTALVLNFTLYCNFCDIFA